MKFEIPKPLQAEHEALHATLVKATKEPGAVGEAAREVARLLHPHSSSGKRSSRCRRLHCSSSLRAAA